jgi:hypothetical protein
MCSRNKYKKDAVLENQYSSVFYSPTLYNILVRGKYIIKMPLLLLVLT